MKAVILAAGYAVRLRPLTLDTPKPLLKIGKHRIMDRILDKIYALKEVTDTYIIVNNKFFEKFSEWLRSCKYRKKISLVNDGTDTNETRLGAIRDLELAIREKAIDDDLLVVAGDNLFELDLNKFISFAVAKPDGASVALHDIKDSAAARKFGVVKLDERGSIIDFEEKPEKPKTTLVSTGIYYFPKEKVALIKEYVKMQDKKLDAPGYCISWLSANDRVYGFAFREDWCDIGDIESYKKADAKYSKKES